VVQSIYPKNEYDITLGTYSNWCFTDINKHIPCILEIETPFQKSKISTADKILTVARLTSTSHLDRVRSEGKIKQDLSGFYVEKLILEQEPGNNREL
jgi:hypothetical protein